MSKNVQFHAIGNKDLRSLAREAVHEGWTIELTKGNHLRWVPPGGGDFYISPLTPRTGRCVQRIKSFMRKAANHAHR